MGFIRLRLYWHVIVRSIQASGCLQVAPLRRLSLFAGCAGWDLFQDLHGERVASLNSIDKPPRRESGPPASNCISYSLVMCL